MPPIVVTLAVDDAAQARFDAERSRYFPSGRTVIGAHVTLFHALPDDPEVAAVATEVARRPTFDVTVAEVRSLGRGVAYRLVSPELQDVHARLRRPFADRLTRQDAQPFHPHVTIQNKVSPDEARATLVEVQRGFAPYAVRATGLRLWHYLDGPWEPLARADFTAG